MVVLAVVVTLLQLLLTTTQVAGDPVECFGNKECRKSYYEPSRLANSIDECCRSGTASTSVKLNKDRKNPEGFVGGCFPCQGDRLSDILERFKTSIGDPVTDTIVKDPLYTVPVHFVGNFINTIKQKIQKVIQPPVHLCYEVYARDGSFNLISTDYTSVNALYKSGFINEIGVQTLSLQPSLQCAQFKIDETCSVFEKENNVPPVEIINFPYIPFQGGEIYVHKYPGTLTVLVSLYNGGEPLLIQVDCHKPSLRFSVRRSFQFLKQNPHGLLGQFWGRRLNLKNFFPHGKTINSLIPTDRKFIISVPEDDHSDPGPVPVPTLPPPLGSINGTLGRQDDPISFLGNRVFAGWFYRLTWEKLDRKCLYVGDKQAGPSYEVVYPNDAVIQGKFWEYETPGLFNPHFSFFKASSVANICMPNH